MVGLGNPGDRYAGTRHNVGFDVVEAFAKRAAGGPARIDRLDCRALTGRVKVAGRTVLLARPQTFMNESGVSVKGLTTKYEVTSERLVVVSDEAALPVGQLRFRRSGSAGGHQGLQSVIDCLGTEDFPRLRLGVRGGTFREAEDLADFVLERFSKAERPAVDEMVERACGALSVFVEEGIDAAMNRFNRSPEETPENT